MRITHAGLRVQVQNLNVALERPVEQFTSKVGQPTKFSVGHLCLVHDASGYSLEEQTSDHGSVHLVCSGKTASQMDIFLDGMVRGIAFRNVQIGQRVLRNAVSKAGHCAADAPLYPADITLIPADDEHTRTGIYHRPVAF